MSEKSASRPSVRESEVCSVRGRTRKRKYDKPNQYQTETETTEILTASYNHYKKENNNG